MQTEELFKLELKKQAELHSPYECCGFVIQHDLYSLYPCKNIAPDPKNFFLIDPLDYKVAGEKFKVIGIYHSHVNGSSEPSELDKKNAEDIGLDSYIYSLRDDSLVVYKPKGFEQPLVKREFCYGISDCWVLVQDYYARRLGISLYDINPFRSNVHDIINGNMVETTVGLLLSNYNFIEVNSNNTLKENDLLMMKLASPVPDHLAIYIGDSMIWHALRNKGYCHTFYGNHFKNKTIKILRHRSFA